MNDTQGVRVRVAELPEPASAAWWIVLRKELRELWIGGKALLLILVYAVVMAVSTFILVQISQVDLTPPKEMVYSILQDCIYFGVFAGLVLGADSISGERDRAALEPLLLTPASRRQIVVGKLLAGVSPWPVMLVVAVPFMIVLAQGDGILGGAVVWGALMGSLLALSFTAMGMLVSYRSNSNRASLFVSLTLYALLLFPAILPGYLQKGRVGKFFQRVDPLAASDEFLEKILVNNRTLREFHSWLRGPVVFAVLMVGLLLLLAAPRLRVQAGPAQARRGGSRGRDIGA
jgi:ABC-2 type transport system permease protein